MNTVNQRFNIKHILETVHKNRCILKDLNETNGNVSFVYVEKIIFARDKQIVLHCQEEKYSFSYRWKEIDEKIIKEKFAGKKTVKLIIKFVKSKNEWVSSDVLFLKIQPQLYQLSEIQKRIHKDYTSVGMEDVDNIMNFAEVMKDKKYLQQVILPSSVLIEIWFFVGAEIIHNVKKN